MTRLAAIALLLACVACPAHEYTQQTVEYKTGLDAVVILPLDSQHLADRPVFITFSGGGFLNSTITAAEATSSFMAARGVVCVMAEYTISGSSSPAALQAAADAAVGDVDDLITYLGTQAVTWDLDMSNIILHGVSAGGQLAMMYAYGPDEPTGIVGVATQMSGPTLTATDETVEVTFGTDDLDSGDPPALMFNGDPDSDGDLRYRYETVNSWKSALTTATITYTAFTFDDAAHGDVTASTVISGDGRTVLQYTWDWCMTKFGAN